MLTIKKILCTTDFSAPSLKGVDYAVELAKVFKAELVVTHVLPMLPPTSYAPNIAMEVPEFEAILHKESADKLNELVKTRIPAAVKAQALIGHGNAAKEVVRIAGETKTDLIVIAAQGHTAWHDFVLGSVTEKVVRHAPCPVFIVR
jgi:nucleotide-binding universal stress UspA family protein